MWNTDKEQTRTLLMWSTKLVAAGFQSPATLHFFLKVFKSRPLLEQRLTAWAAVFLIDILLIASLWILEDTDTDPRKRGSWAFMAIFLTFAVIAIGFYDEGWLSWGPRVGIIGLTINAVLTWLIDWKITYNTREAQEQRLRDKMVIKRREIEQEAHEKAMDKLKPHVIQLMAQREIERLKMWEFISDDVTVIDQPVVEKPHQLEAINEPDPVTKEGVVYLGNGEYGWQLDASSEVIKESPTTGNTYTSEHGAYLARLAAIRKAKKKNDSSSTDVW